MSIPSPRTLPPAVLPHLTWVPVFSMRISPGFLLGFLASPSWGFHLMLSPLRLSSLLNRFTTSLPLCGAFYFLCSRSHFPLVGFFYFLCSRLSWSLLKVLLSSFLIWSPPRPCFSVPGLSGPARVQALGVCSLDASCNSSPSSLQAPELCFPFSPSG